MVEVHCGVSDYLLCFQLKIKDKNIRSLICHGGVHQ